MLKQRIAAVQQWNVVQGPIKTYSFLPASSHIDQMGFVHAGQMAEALARGFIDKGVVKAKDVHCTDPVQARREVFESFGAQSQSSNVDVSSVI